MLLPILLASTIQTVPSIEFTFEVRAKPAIGKPLKVWIPVASDNSLQDVSAIEIDSPGSRPTLMTENEYGNRIVFLTYNEAPADLNVTVTYNVVRKHTTHLNGIKDPSNKAQFLQPDLLVPTTERYQRIAREVVRGKSNEDKMKSIYNHVIATMTYDYKKESPRLGMGDVAFVCDYKSGNCSDLHSYVISLARASGIPAYLEYGFPITGIPIPNSISSTGSIGGYHCWTWYYDMTKGWLPLDASDGRRWTDAGEAELGKSLYNQLVPMRSAVAVSRGRDITLAPRQAGEPLNNFIKPHAQQNYKPVEAAWTVSYKLN